jgi:hypothetical protein
VLEYFREVVAVDFEFIATAGNRPVPVCFVAHELRSGGRFRVWRDQFGPAPPYATGTDVLFVAYYASAELGCYRVLGWPMPERILDLFTEFRARTNGLNTPAGNSLLGALAYFGLDGMGAVEKEDMRALILRGGPWSDAERLAILDYCEGDVDALRRLLVAMSSKLIPWPVLESGNLDLSDDTFRQQARAYPALSPLRELRSSLSDLRLNDLAVGADGRNRTILSAFRSRTGRNQPSNTRFIFGPSVWLRGLIKPPPGQAVAYVDWSQQEIGIAAALSGDQILQAAYQSGDCYLAFAKQASAVPHNATKTTHGAQRELFKQCMLAVQYGMEWQSLALRTAQPGIVARDLLRAHRQTYRRFWEWSDAAVDQAMLVGVIWPIRIGEQSNRRSLRNFPMQANAAEMLRVACCLATERGIEVCAPVHDAVLICAPDIFAMRAAMAEASRFVLAGFELSTDVKVTRWPDRYMDPRGCQMWERVCSLVAQAEPQQMGLGA